ncbi:MAG: discoidin domain-containing protein [Planctomycetaceae bacterium]|nr:discoidin domain-containing protein [Planctomycetaceae bacterium]
MHRLSFIVYLLLLVFSAGQVRAADTLEAGFRNPPPDSETSKRMSCFWWWLNGHVNKASITKDLTAMAQQGYGSAMLFDGNGSSQDGNIEVPPGPLYGSPEWKELFVHAVKEADRLGLKMHLMIMSGWNLGGPNITPEYAAKKITYSVTSLGANQKNVKLPQPPTVNGFYKDIAVLAFPAKDTGYVLPAVKCTVTASSQQTDYPPSNFFDGDDKTFWVSQGTKPGEGVSKDKPQWIDIEFEKEVTADKIYLTSRSGYGPKNCTVIVDGKEIVNAGVSEGKQTVLWVVAENKPATIAFPKTSGKKFRLLFTDAFDPSYPDKPRNVQIAEIVMYSGNTMLTPSVKKRKPLSNFNIKIATSEFGGSAPDCSPLYDDDPELPADPDFNIDDAVDLTDELRITDYELRMDDNNPKFNAIRNSSFVILRIGYTLTGAKTSTSSGKFQGLVLDHLRHEAFDFYWNDTVKPLLDAVKPYCGKTLQNLETDSWEAGGMNWTERFRDEFKQRRGYDLQKYLPIACGYIGNNRSKSNEFLADFRRTIGDLIADEHYAQFKKRAREYNLGFMPESGGPHGAPIDAQQLLGMSDVPMSEFWSWSPRHRVGNANRFFVKQPASAAHTNGKRFVAAEGLTNIGMYWQESFAENLKPSFDQAVCEGLNLLVWHTFTSSPIEAGLPGNLYFAGTYFNPQCTVWNKAKPFIDYINRVDFMMQQGIPVADVLEFYGSGVPNFTQGEWANTAGCAPGYDWDVCSEDVLLKLKMENGELRIPFDDIPAAIRMTAAKYKVLVIPEAKRCSPNALKKIEELKQAGAVIAVKNDVREALQKKGIRPDFEIATPLNDKSRIEWIHRRVDDTDVYFVANLTNQAEKFTAKFRAAGEQAELWDAVTGTVRLAEPLAVGEVKLDLPPFGSTFAVFRPAVSRTGLTSSNADRKRSTADVDLANWSAEFRSPFKEEQPFTVQMDKLDDWLKNSDERIRYFSGEAVYKTTVGVDVSRLTPGTDGKPSAADRVYLQFDRVCEFAEVKINGKICGTVWAHPYKLDITDAIGAEQGKLPVEKLDIEITVANRWVNRLVGDAIGAAGGKPRLTKTNITHITGKTPLMPSGVIGSVKIVTE